MSNTILLRSYTGLRLAIGTHNITINTSDCIAGGVLFNLLGSRGAITVGGVPAVNVGAFAHCSAPPIGSSVNVQIVSNGGINNLLWGCIYVLSYGDEVISAGQTSGITSTTTSVASRVGAMGFANIQNPPSPGPYILASSVLTGAYLRDDIRYGDGGDGKICMDFDHKNGVDTDNAESFFCTIGGEVTTTVSLCMVGHNITGKPFSRNRRG